MGGRSGVEKERQIEVGKGGLFRESIRNDERFSGSLWKITNGNDK